VDLEILTDRVLTVDEQKLLRSLHPGIINIRPRLRTEEVQVMSPVNREGRRIDELFRDYYKYRMGVDIPDELMEAFLDIVNDGHDDHDRGDAPEGSTGDEIRENSMGYDTHADNRQDEDFVDISRMPEGGTETDET
jgi:exonuclease SbcD